MEVCVRGLQQEAKEEALDCDAEHSAWTVRCPVSSDFSVEIPCHGAVLSCHGYSSSTRDSRYLSARFFVSVTFSAVAIARLIHSPPAWGSAFMAVELETS